MILHSNSEAFTQAFLSSWAGAAANNATVYANIYRSLLLVHEFVCDARPSHWGVRAQSRDGGHDEVGHAGSAMKTAKVPLLRSRTRKVQQFEWLLSEFFALSRENCFACSS
jgi:hypothetical protein